jgi:hypothetical protein
MPEQTQLTFSHQEVVTSLLKTMGIREGIWALHVKFGLRAATLGSSDTDVNPTAILPVLEIGIQKAEKVTNVSVDAAVVNGATPPPRLIGSGKSKSVKKKK